MNLHIVRVALPALALSRMVRLVYKKQRRISATLLQCLCWTVLGQLLFQV